MHPAESFFKTLKTLLTVFTEIAIEGFAQATEESTPTVKEFNGKGPGDPKKLASASVSVVDMEEPPSAETPLRGSPPREVNSLPMPLRLQRYRQDSRIMIELGTNPYTHHFVNDQTLKT